MTNNRPNAVLRYVRRVAEGQSALDLPDGDLLQRFIEKHDDAAFTALVRRHGPMVFGLCRRVLGNVQDAEDAFQATFLVLSKKAASSRLRESLGGWLHCVAYRIAQRARIAAARRRKHEGQRPGARVADPLSQLTLREGQEILDWELARMPDKFRAPLVLCYLQGMTRDEAAHQLGWSPGILKTRLEQARERLRGRLAARGLALSGAMLALLFVDRTASAAVPSPLLASTVRASLCLATKTAFRSMVSPEVTALTEGVLRTMYLKKLTGAAAALLVCLAIGTTGLATFRAAAGDQKGAKQAVALDQPTPGPVEQPADPPAPAVRVAVQPGGQVVPYESTSLESVAFSPDNRLLVGGGQGKAVLTWDMEKNQPGQVFKDLKGIVRRVALSPDGKSIVAGIDGGTILIWNVKTGKLEAELQADLPSKPNVLGINGHVNNFVFLPGGKLAALYTYQPKNGADGSQGEQLLIWDIKTRQPLVLHEAVAGTSVDLAASPDGKFLAVTRYVDGLEVWDVETSKVVWHEKLAKNDFMSRAVFAPNGETLAVGGGHSIVGAAGIGAEGKLWLFDVKRQKLLHCISNEIQSGAYNAIAFTADSRGVIAGSTSGKTVDYRTQTGRKANKVVSEMRRWDVANGKEVWRAEGELGWFHAIAASADGKLIAASDGKRLMLFDPEKGTRKTELMDFPNPLD